jgi:hypothetical protein
MILAGPLTREKTSPAAPLFGLAALKCAGITFRFANREIDEGDEE